MYLNLVKLSNNKLLRVPKYFFLCLHSLKFVCIPDITLYSELACQYTYIYINAEL